jgi:EAL domain-containing protein (putative c-di-GMP-specific phosphodiesterase class I)
LGGAPRLSFNVHASTLGRDPGFVAYLAEMLQHHGHPASRFTVEIVEHAPVWGGRSFQLALDDLRALGVAVALDDVGLGNSNFRMILECRPDYFKVDRFLVAGASEDYFRRAILRSIADLSGTFGAHVVAEGLDNDADLRVVIDEGIALAQGFLLSPPQPASTLKVIGVLQDALFAIGPGGLEAIAPVAVGTGP